MALALGNGHSKMGRVGTLSRKAFIVNADEVEIRAIPVNFVEWEEETEQVGSRTITRRTPVQRRALINDYVPASLYDTFMAMFDDVRSFYEATQGTLVQDGEQALQMAPESEEDQQKRRLANLKGEQLRQFQGLQYQLVLAVWRLTESGMDEKRLREGLDEDQILGLFNHFFTRLSRLKKSRAKPGVSTSSANEPEPGEE